MIHNISGVILAGGASKRFDGITKSKIVIEGRSIISRILDVFADIFDEKIIVTNSPDEYIDFIDECKITGDIYFNKGPLGGIHSSFTATTKDSVFVVGGDMPSLDKKLILRQIKFFEKNNCDGLVPMIGQNIEPLHSIYKKSLRKTLEGYLESDNNYSIREFFKETDICYFPVSDTDKSRMAFTNINSPADLRNYNK